MGNATLNSESCYEMRMFSPSAEGCSANNLDNLIFSVSRPSKYFEEHYRHCTAVLQTADKFHTFHTLKHTFKKTVFCTGGIFFQPGRAKHITGR